jgi:hypothetical protein
MTTSNLDGDHTFESRVLHFYLRVKGSNSLLCLHLFWLCFEIFHFNMTMNYFDTVLFESVRYSKSFCILTVPTVSFVWVVKFVERLPLDRKIWDWNPHQDTSAFLLRWQWMNFPSVKLIGGIFIYLFVYLIIYIFIYLFIYLIICLIIYLFDRVGVCVCAGSYIQADEER